MLILIGSKNKRKHLELENVINYRNINSVGLQRERLIKFLSSQNTIKYQCENL